MKLVTFLKASSLVLLTALLLGCQFLGLGPQTGLSSMKQITAFGFSAALNSALTVSATGTVSESTTTIAVSLPAGTSVTALRAHNRPGGRPSPRAGGFREHRKRHLVHDPEQRQWGGVPRRYEAGCR
ncbi:MAG: hypothetical protein WCG80_03205 [Spirochaetales bacterium]